MATLYEITADLRALDDLLDEIGGDLTDPEVERVTQQWTDELFASLDKKADGYASLIAEIHGRAEIRRAESKRLLERAKADEAKAEWLTSRLFDAMRATNQRLIETPRFRISIQRNGGKLPIDIHDEVPQEWCRVRYEADKERIRETLESGGTLPFAVLCERGERLVIK